MCEVLKMEIIPICHPYPNYIRVKMYCTSLISSFVVL
jgi:hypothetical protein